MNLILFSITVSLFAIAYGLLLIRQILKLSVGTKKMQEIASAIAEGSSAYLKRQYTVISFVAIILFLILIFTLGLLPAISFLFGAFASALAGFAAMHISVRANIRTAQSAKKGLQPALKTAFSGGIVIGLFVAGLALFSISSLLLIIFSFQPLSSNLQPLIALGFGSSLISVFARLGGGIYTKAADVGTDIVGKIEKGIPEDDPRNPGVIADLVGDNVGDCAGMAADLFETYIVTAVAAMLLAKITFPDNQIMIAFPLVVGSIAIIASIIGSLFVKVKEKGSIMFALYKGLLATIVFAVIGLFLFLSRIPLPHSFSFFSLLASLFLGFFTAIAMVIITEYYTSKNFSPVRNLARASITGHGTNIINGLSNSLKSTLAPVLVIAGVTLISYNLAGLFGIALSAMSMLSLTSIIVAIDSFGPITDNAGGIAEMANLSSSIRKITDALDAVGNTTKAVTKAYAIASAGLAALVLFAGYTQEISHLQLSASNFSLSTPVVLVGLFIGASLPYFFSALAMEAVSKAAGSIVTEIRRQFKEIKGILSGQTKPQYGRCVDIVVRAALKEMILPASIPVLAPVFVAKLLGPQALAGLLVGVIITGLFVAISMTTGGAAWDNAKKYIESGNFGGKGSFAHQSAVTGDTVGDPYKDTAGPAINPMIKVVNIIALLLAPMF